MKFIESNTDMFINKVDMIIELIDNLQLPTEQTAQIVSELELLSGELSLSSGIEGLKNKSYHKLTIPKKSNLLEVLTKEVEVLPHGSYAVLIGQSKIEIYKTKNSVIKIVSGNCFMHRINSELTTEDLTAKIYLIG